MYLRTISFSTNLERIGVTDIGRKSVKLFTEETLGMGVTNALFQAEGGLPVLNVLFTKLAITHVNSTAQCLKTQYGILWNPGAVLLTEIKSLYISYSETE